MKQGLSEGNACQENANDGVGSNQKNILSNSFPLHFGRHPQAIT